MSRSTQGVTLINLDEGEKLAGLERVVETEDEDERVARRDAVMRTECGASRPLPDARSNRRCRCSERLEIDRRRDAIDALDRELLRLLNERAAHAQDRSARSRGDSPPTGPSARRRCCARSQAENRGPLPDEAVDGRVSPDHVGVPRAGAAAAVAYLGPAGTFSHAAVTQAFRGSGRRRAVRVDR